jgi:predicted alpha/beta hydrolase family esterase
MTEENWQGTYKAAMDSVNLLNNGKPEGDSAEDWAGTVQRNVDHLKIIVAKDWPEGYDMKPFNDAIAANA